MKEVRGFEETIQVVSSPIQFLLEVDLVQEDSILGFEAWSPGLEGSILGGLAPILFLLETDRGKEESIEVLDDLVLGFLNQDVFLLSLILGFFDLVQVDEAPDRCLESEDRVLESPAQVFPSQDRFLQSLDRFLESLCRFLFASRHGA